MQDAYGNTIPFSVNMQDVNAPYVHDVRGILPRPMMPTPQHFLPYPQTFATALQPSARYDAMPTVFGHDQYSSFHPYVRQDLMMPRAAEIARPLVTPPFRYPMHNVIPKARGPDVNLCEVAMKMVAQESRAPMGGVASTYRYPSPIPVQPHTSSAASSKKATKSHHKKRNNSNDPVTAEDLELIAVTPQKWHEFLKIDENEPLKTVAEYEAIFAQIRKIRNDNENAQRELLAEQRGESHAPSKTIKQLQKEYQDNKNAHDLQQVLARAGTSRSRQPVNRLGDYK